MPIPKDIYRSAQIYINRYGDEAEDYAMRMMNKFGRDDIVAASAWRIIAEAINELQTKTPPDVVH